MDGNNNSFPKHLRQPCKERRSFGVDVHHIVFSKCTIKCRKCGGADCSKSPWCQDRDKKILKKSKKISPTRLFWQFFESSGPCRAIRYLMLFYFHTACNGVFSIVSLNCSTVIFAFAAARSSGKSPAGLVKDQLRRVRHPQPRPQAGQR